jgi:putative membrane protein
MDQATAAIAASLSGLPLFALFAGSCIVALAVFIIVYTLITPHHELTLVRQGNVAAAVSFGGAVIGFVIPLGQAVAQSANLLDMAVWSAVALVVQLLVFGLTTLLLRGASKKIEAGDMAAGCFLALMAVAGGILNAACMTYTD